jgi:hypothetical protein
MCPGAVLHCVPRGWVGESACGVRCLLVSSADSCKQLWNWPAGRNGIPILSAHHSVGRLSMAYGSRMSQSWILIDALSFVEREKNHYGAFFPEHASVAVPCKIFTVVSCN